MTLEKMQAELGLQIVPDCFAGFYKNIADSWENRSKEILSDTYICGVLEENQILTDRLDVILQAAAEVRENPAMCLLVCLLEQWAQKGGIPEDGFKNPKGTGLAYDFYCLFATIPTIPQTVANLQKRGLPADVIADTMAEYDFCVQICENSLGRPAFEFGRLWWIQRVIHSQLVHIDRFKYDLPGRYSKGIRIYENANGEQIVLADGMELHRSGAMLGTAGLEDTDGSFTADITETETTVEGHSIVNGFVQQEKIRLDKKEWKLIFSPTDNVLGIHIPPGGGFDKETMDKSFDRAKELFRKCYPDHPFKAFHCRTWLLAPQLQNILKPDSNILAFQNRFIRYPYRSNGKECMSFLFNLLTNDPENLNDLPENTSLQRAVKAIYLNGGCIHEGEGIFF